MGLFSKFKAGLAKTHGTLVHEIKRIITRSPKLTRNSNTPSSPPTSAWP